MDLFRIPPFPESHRIVVVACIMVTKQLFFDSTSLQTWYPLITESIVKDLTSDSITHAIYMTHLTQHMPRFADFTIANITAG